MKLEIQNKKLDKDPDQRDKGMITDINHTFMGKEMP